MLTQPRDDILLEAISTIKERIKEDKETLKNIINAINNGNSSDLINEKLIDKLTVLTYDDDKVADAMEHIALVFANTETQHIRSNKDILNEFITVLKHHVDILNTLENTIVIFNRDIKHHVKNAIDEHNDINKPADEVKVKPEPVKTKESVFNKILEVIPKSGMPAVMFYGTFFFIALAIVLIVNNDFILQVKDTMDAAKSLPKVNNESF